MSFCARIGAAALALLLISFDVNASCIEDARTVQLNADTVRIKSYSCSAAGSSSRVKVEFHRLSNSVASLVAEGRSSTMLDRALGTFRLVRNDVIATYAMLLRQFGIIHNLGDQVQVTLRVETAGRGGNAAPADSISGESVAILYSGSRGSYPAFDEIVSLRGAVIPNNIKFYYSGSLANRVTRYYWRALSNDDFVKYFGRLTSYNKMLGYASPSPTFIPNDLKLARYLAGTDWPTDFVLLIGRYVTTSDAAQICGGEAGWAFEYWTRPIMMEVVLVENTSGVPIRLDGLIGRKAPESGLHILNTSPQQARDLRPFGQLSENLSPGEKVLIPTKIVLSAQPFSAREWENTNEIYRSIGANQSTGNTTGHAVPSLKNYAYGSELIVTGITVDGQRIDFSQRSANFFNITISSLEGSCPYLLSWKSSRERWLEHGKALHRAQGSAQQETETWNLSGFVPRFRLEEREPEVAYIDFAGLAVALRDGSVIELVSNDRALSARDQDYVRLAWGDAIEFDFQLPDGITPSDVLESRLSLTGYYDRYPRLSKLVQDQAPPNLPGLARPGKPRPLCALPILPIANNRKDQ